MITIRKATIDDLGAVAPLFDQYRQFYEQAPDLAAATDFLRARIEAGESTILVAIDDGDMTGFCQLYPIFSSVSMRRAWLLNDLYVVGSARGKGVATALLSAADEFGRGQQAKWLLLQTGATNGAAQALYEKNGWLKEHDLFYTKML